MKVKISPEGSGKTIKSANNVVFKQSSVDKAFSKHAHVFGNYADGSKKSVEKFTNDVKDLINTGTQKSGSWWGSEGTHVYNETTRQWAFVNADCTFNTAFRLSQQQYKHLMETGVVK